MCTQSHDNSVSLDVKTSEIIIRLEVRLQLNTGNTLRPVLLVFTRSGITPPKVNRFG